MNNNLLCFGEISDIVQAMSLSEMLHIEGHEKKAQAMHILGTAGLLNDTNKELIENVIDFIIYIAKNKKALNIFTKSNCNKCF